MDRSLENMPRSFLNIEGRSWGFRSGGGGRDGTGWTPALAAVGARGAPMAKNWTAKTGRLAQQRGRSRARNSAVIRGVGRIRGAAGGARPAAPAGRAAAQPATFPPRRQGTA